VVPEPTGGDRVQAGLQRLNDSFRLLLVVLLTQDDEAGDGFGSQGVEGDLTGG
jgi:hypothetical protein